MGASADRSQLPPEREQLPPLEVPAPACMEQAELRLKMYAMSAIGEHVIKNSAVHLVSAAKSNGMFDVMRQK